MIDTHCHIDLYENPFEVINRCEKERIITIGMTNLPSHFEMGYPHFKNLKMVRLALGLHPLYAQHHKQEFELFLKNFANTSYIGEIGLDFSKEGFNTKQIQVHYFKKILSKLQGEKKIISLHSRKAEREIFNLLVEYNIQNAIFHWYSGPLYLIGEITAKGYYFSINTSMIKSKAGQEIIKKIPKQYVLTESDGPFIDFKNRPVRPSDIITILHYLSKLWNMEISEVEKVINENFKKMLQTIR